jgi:uncharacterized protein (DUF1778 family)
MELGPPAGRPEKNPEERLKEVVQVRVCPSHKELITRESDRRSTTITNIVLQIGIEEMHPAGRYLSRPALWDWLFDRSEELLVTDYRLSDFSVTSFAEDFRLKAENVSQRRDERKRLWEDAGEETRTERIGVRLKTRTLAWLEQRAEKQGTSRSSLLRVRTLEGIRSCSRLAQIEQWLKGWLERLLVIAESESETFVGDYAPKLKEIGREIEDALDQIEDVSEEG